MATQRNRGRNRGKSNRRRGGSNGGNTKQMLIAAGIVVLVLLLGGGIIWATGILEEEPIQVEKFSFTVDATSEEQIFPSIDEIDTDENRKFCYAGNMLQVKLVTQNVYNNVTGEVEEKVETKLLSPSMEDITQGGRQRYRMEVDEFFEETLPEALEEFKMVGKTYQEVIVLVDNTDASAEGEPSIQLIADADAEEEQVALLPANFKAKALIGSGAKLTFTEILDIGTPLKYTVEVKSKNRITESEKPKRKRSVARSIRTAESYLNRVTQATEGTSSSAVLRTVIEAIMAQDKAENGTDIYVFSDMEHNDPGSFSVIEKPATLTDPANWDNALGLLFPEDPEIKATLSGLEGENVTIHVIFPPITVGNRQLKDEVRVGTMGFLNHVFADTEVDITSNIEY